MAKRLEIVPVEIHAPKRKFEAPSVTAHAAFDEMGVEVETLSSVFPPTAKWTKHGEACIGVYEGCEENIGPNKSMLYYFNYKGHTFGVWGTTMIDRVMDSGKVEAGDLVQITYIGELSTDRSPCKMFEFKVGRKKKK